MLREHHALATVKKFAQQSIKGLRPVIFVSSVRSRVHSLSCIAYCRSWKSILLFHSASHFLVGRAFGSIKRAMRACL